MGSYLAVLFACLVAPGWVQAQTGTITGRVTSAAGQPLADTRVQVVGTTRGAMTDAQGNYRIAAVPAGGVQVRALRLGYTAQTRQATVSADASVEVNFSLAETATTLDQVVVTATGETQRRRESGVSVGVIDTSMINVAATPQLSNILSARTPGVTIQSGSGTSGTASRVRIRGSNSINLSNEPLLIVDGVRANNNPTSFSVGVGGQMISRLEDFNPEDIESIDVIKGPAAAALYGTAAANGVIQITTKKGRAGRTRWNAYEEYGTVQDVYDYPNNYARIGTLTAPPAPPALQTTPACTLEREVLSICVPKADSLIFWNPIENVSPFRTGWRQTHGLNANGGTEGTTYYIGGEYEREQGVYDVNRLQRITGRSNVRMQLRNDLDATLTLGVVRFKLQLPFNDNSAFGAIAAGFLGKAYDCSPANTAASNPNRIAYCQTDSLSRGYFNANIPSTQYFNVENRQQNDRLTAGLNTNWTPLPWLRGVGQLGMDVLNRVDEQLIPPNKVFFSTSTLEGSRFSNRIRLPTYNMTGSLTASYDIPWGGFSALRGQSTVGGQYTREDFRNTSASGAVLLPGTGSLGGASARFTVGETNQEIITFGGFLQQQFTHADRLFLTVALRTDRNSAFGTDFKWVAYPSANLSWVISEEGFFPRTDFIDQLRLRAGYGSSGQRPVFRDAATWFNPVSMRVGANEVPAISVGGTGNVNLKPELSTEYEAGFESSLFRNRVTLEFTGYSKSTTDAIVSQRLAPSLGVSSTKLINLGEVQNRGIEALTSVQVLDMPNVELNTTVTFTTHRNKLINLGAGIQPIFFGFGATQQHRNGYPLGGYFERKILSYEDKDGNGIITRINCPTYESANPQQFGGPECEMVLSDSLEYLGSPLPLHEAGFNAALTLFKYARISALLDYRGGHKIFNSTSEFRCTLGTPNCLSVYDKNVGLEEQARTVARYMGAETGFIEDASFMKFRELAVTLTAPDDWARRAKVSSLSLTFAGRNLATWTDYTGLDPEVNANANSANAFTTSDFLTQPPVRYFVTRLNINF